MLTSYLIVSFILDLYRIKHMKWSGPTLTDKIATVLAVIIFIGLVMWAVYNVYAYREFLFYV